MDKIGMGVICKNCGKVFGEHINGGDCPTQFEPATPAPTQPEKSILHPDILVGRIITGQAVYMADILPEYQKRFFDTPAPNQPIELCPTCPKCSDSHFEDEPHNSRTLKSVPTQPSEVGPKMSLPDSTEVDYPLKPPFKVVQFGDEFSVCDEEKTIVEGIVFRNELNADWIAEALNAYAFGQSTARSQEGRLREALEKILALKYTHDVHKNAPALKEGCPGCIAWEALTASPEVKS